MMNQIQSNDINDLRLDVESNQQDCVVLREVIQSMINAAVSSKKSSAPKSIATSDIVFKSAKSVRSIQAIESNNDDMLCDTITQENVPVQGISGMEEFINLASTGEIEFSDAFIKELYNVNCRVDAVNRVSSNLQERWCSLEQKVSQLESSIVNLKNDLKVEFNYVKQYQMVDNLIAHKFPLPTVMMTSLEFCKYVADQFNILLPQLPIPIKWEHISTAHPLPTRSGTSNTIVIRFSNRCIKDMIYSHRNYLKNGVLITEHLTQFNQSICNKAKSLFSSNCTVYTESCKIYINIDGKSHRLNSIDDVHKLFVKYCERIGGNDNYKFITPSTTTPLRKLCYVPKIYASTVMPHHSVSNRVVSTPSSSYNYRGRRSTGYSVYNRHY